MIDGQVMSLPHPDNVMEALRKEFDPRASIVWLFRGRCVICGEEGTEVNEIVPRARTRGAIQDWRNQVLMCHDHHTEYHQNGVTQAKISRLTMQRVRFLIQIGRENFV